MITTVEKKLKIISLVDPGLEQFLEKNQMEGLDPRLDNNGWWYLHGELANKLGYDGGIIYNMDEFPEYQREVNSWTEISGGRATLGSTWHKEIYLNGIVECEIKSLPGQKAIGYFWVIDEREVVGRNKKGYDVKFMVWRQRGLVVLASDEMSIEYAKQKYNRKEAFY